MRRGKIKKINYLVLEVLGNDYKKKVLQIDRMATNDEPKVVFRGSFSFKISQQAAP